MTNTDTPTVDLLKHRKIGVQQALSNTLMNDQPRLVAVTNSHLENVLTEAIWRRLLIKPNRATYKFTMDISTEFTRDMTVFRVSWRENTPEPDERTAPRW